jgi:AcrR family transcriptional regulator
MLDAAYELFSSQGIADTTIEQICDRADVANRTFFNHFSTRQEMIRALAVDRLQNIHTALAHQSDMTMPVRLVAFFDDVAERLSSSSRAYRGLVVAMFGAAGTGIERGSDLHSTFLALVKAGVADGQVTDRHDPSILADIVVGSFSSGLMNWATDDTYSILSGLHEIATALEDLLAPE